MRCVSCVYRRVAEGSGLDSGGCVVDVNVDAWRVVVLWAVYPTLQNLWSAQAVLSLYGMLKHKICCEILLLMNVAHSTFQTSPVLS